MGKCLMLAVAGSGKTTFLINQLNLEQRFLLVTYTRNNYEHLRRSITRKFGYFPENIKVLKYFQFLYSFCFKPYCGLEMNAKGICFDFPPDWTRYHRGENVFYRTAAGRMFSNRIAYYCITNSVDYIRERLDKYYDFFFIDEVQDLAGHDFNLLLSILPDRCDSMFVGDFYQHTYETSNDGNVNHGLYDGYRRYLKKWTDVGVSIDTETLAKTHRCCAEVCSFVTDMGIAIESTGEANGHVIILDKEEDADAILTNGRIPKLFLEKSNQFRCASMNWGASKGIDSFEDVCVVMNKTTLALFEKGKLNELNPKTKNKLYVACTRAHRHLYIVSYKFLEKYKKV